LKVIQEGFGKVMKKRAFIGTVVAFLLISAGTGAFLLFDSPFTHTGQANRVRQPLYTVHRSEGVPFSTHRALSMVANEQITALLPWGIALDSLSGFIWVAEPGCDPSIRCPVNVQGALGQYAFSDGTLIQNLNEPDGYSSPLFVTVDGNGDVWFTQPDSDAIGEYNPQNQQWNQWFLKRGSVPFDLTFDRYGNIWFTEFGSNTIGFFNRRTHAVVEHAIPTPDSNPYGITVDPQGRIWFAENGPGAYQIASFTPTISGATKITEYPTGGLRPHLIAADQAGHIWYSGGFGGDIGEFNPRSGNATQFVVYHSTCSSPTNCTGTHISGISVDTKGDVWFTDSLSNRVGYLIPSTGQVVARTLDISNAHPYDGLMIDRSERVWFTEEFESILTMWPASALK
jgi:virginiamycin B lyase